jgi:alpha-tubulin suppressor-like RCC1 family protein
MPRQWALVVLALAGCDRFLQLTYLPDAPPAEGPDGPPPVNCMRDVAAGRTHTCAVDPAGAVYCWGGNEHDQSQPGGPNYVLTPIQIILPMPAVEVGAGNDLSCARLEDGSVWCWGYNAEGELGDGTTTGHGPGRVALPAGAAAIGVGSRYACAILATDHSIACWGSNKYASLDVDPATPSESTPVVAPNTAGTQQLSVGHRHACVLDATGQVQCWGSNFEGQNGVPSSTTAVYPPNVIASLGSIARVTASGRTTCVVTTNGDVECFGRGGNGELANGAFNSSVGPASTLVHGASDVALGTTGGCALLADGTVSCWGDFDGAKGAAETTNTPAMAMLDHVTKLSAHFYHQCALANGKVVCWGGDQSGELGRGSRAVQPSPQTVNLPGIPTAIAAEGAGACAIVAGSVYCWGRNDYGQIGNNTRIDQLSPMLVAGGSNATGLAAYFQHVCAWNASGAQCWGSDYDGELASGTQGRDVLVPMPFAAANIQQIVLGLDFACAVVAGAVQCVGRNKEGELGDGTFANNTSLVAAGSLVGVAHIAAGEEFVCAINGTAQLYCWGHNRDGQIGDGGTTDVGSPKQVVTSRLFIDVAAGRFHACAIEQTTNAIWCWGNNDDGQLGLGDTNVHAAPATVSLPAGATAIRLVAGETDTCAITANGTVYCWGANDNGELGNGTTNSSTAPIAISALAGAALMTHGQGGGCAVVGGVTKCWGISQMLGDGDNSRSLPAPAIGLPCQ